MTVTSVVNPATEQVIADVPQTPLEEVDAAIERANRAFEGWRQVAPPDRARLLRRFAEAVDGDREQLAQLEVRNSGHTTANARWEAGNVRDVLNYYSAAPERLFGRQIPVPGGIDITFKEPLGVVGVIVPWNFPMPIAAWGLAPGAGGRQHRRPKAGRAHSLDRAPFGRAGLVRRLAARCADRTARPGQRHRRAFC